MPAAHQTRATARIIIIVRTIIAGRRRLSNDRPIIIIVMIWYYFIFFFGKKLRKRKWIDAVSIDNNTIYQRGPRAHGRGVIETTATKTLDTSWYAIIHNKRLLSWKVHCALYCATHARTHTNSVTSITHTHTHDTWYKHSVSRGRPSENNNNNNNDDNYC